MRTTEWWPANQVFHPNKNQMKNYRVEAIVLAAGLAIAGLFVFFGLNSMLKPERVVSVRGLAEREVKADHVIWPIVYKTAGNDLSAVHRDINSAEQKIKAFLKKNGIEEKEIVTNSPQIVDLKAERYSSTETKDRYNVSVTIAVISDKVDLVHELSSRTGELISEGVAISAAEYDTNIQYEFLGLNKIKPEMIEEATKNAREAALKFAKDSNSSVGKIKTASQGLFTITERDSYTPHIKNVRVVTSVDYYLDS